MIFYKSQPWCEPSYGKSQVFNPIKMAELHFQKENVMNKLLSAVAIATAFLISPIANAALTVYNAPSNPFSFMNSDGNTLSFEYSGGTTVSRIAAGDDNPSAPISNQSYNAIGDAIETVFSLPANTFAAESTLSGTFKGDISGSSATITSTIPYDYLAVHFGKYEVFFHFATLVTAGTTFDIFNVAATKTGTGGKGGGLSNFRVYDSGLSEVPIPGALFLLAPALLGLLGFRKSLKA